MRTLALPIALLVFGCPSTPPKPPEPKPLEAGVPTCLSACDNMRALGCELGKPTPRGATCEDVCIRVQTENAGAGFDMACISRATTCPVADACR